MTVAAPDPSAAPAETASAPSQRLPRKARVLWRIEALVSWGVLLAVGLGVSRALPGDAPAVVGVLVWAVPLAVGAVAVAVVPELRWRRWRYEVRDDEVDIRRGLFTVTRTLVPMQRVQHVDTRRGVLDQQLGLATVVLHTAAGTTSIPALQTGEASALRDRIARLTRRPDEL